MFKKNALKIFAALSVLLLVLAMTFTLAPQPTKAQAAPSPTRTNTACPGVAGYVRIGSSTGAGLANVKITGVSVTDDTVATGTTNSSGYYIIGCGRTGMIITPVLSGYTFSPATQTYYGTTPLNFVATAITGNQPDLTVVSITQFPYYDPTATPDAQGCRPNVSYYRIGLRVTIQNIGAVDAGAFVLDFNTIQTTISGLAAGQSLAVDFSGFMLPTTRTATVDITNLVAESNETNNVLTVIVSTITPTRTGTVAPPICITSTPTPTGGVSLTPTRTPTRNTPTKTPTHRTITPLPATSTRTNTPTGGPLTATFTPTAGFCGPTATIAAPFTQDGIGTFCWQATSLGTSAINSWNLVSLTINGLNYTNLYVAASSYPAKLGSYWIVSYNSILAYGHFEAK